jgi:integrase
MRLAADSDQPRPGRDETETAPTTRSASGTPTSVEAIRARMGHRDATPRLCARLRRPTARRSVALTWRDVGKKTITVTKAISVGGERSTKTSRGRTMRLLGPLASELAAWRLASGRPGDHVPVFPRKDGNVRRETDYRNWRRRVFQPASEKAEVGPVRPYDLRHALVSLLLRERLSVVDIARQAGHSPTIITSTYAHLIDELEGTEGRSAEVEIRAARSKLVPLTYLGGASNRVANEEIPANRFKPTPGLEPGTPSLRVKCSTS